MNEDVTFEDWSDLLINEEKWDLPKEIDKSTPLKDLMYIDSKFVPSKFLQMDVHEWKRPYELFHDNVDYVLYKDIDCFTNLLSGSRHLIDNVSIRRFISTIAHLEYISDQEPFDVEHVSSSYHPTTFNNPWRPWHHVYSHTKAGKGYKHNPRLNKFGKYVIRLYWFGCWKRVVVDDLLPIDKYGNVLLPGTIDSHRAIFNSREKCKIELWPYLLFKAVHKLTCENCMAEMTNARFTSMFTSMFTGWLSQTLIVNDLSAEERWKMINKYVPECKSRNEKKNVESNGNNAKSYLIIVSDIDMRHLDTRAIPGVTPTFDLYSYVCENRYQSVDDICEERRLKKFHWLPWTLNADTTSVSTHKEHYVRIVEPFRGIYESSIRNKQSMNVHHCHDAEFQTKNTKQKKFKTDLATRTKDTWIKFHSVCNYLDHFIVFNVPSRFPYWNCITNVKKSLKSSAVKNTDEKKNNVKTIRYSYYYDGQEPLYLLVDTVEETILIVCVQVFGRCVKSRMEPLGSREGSREEAHLPLIQYRINRYAWNERFENEIVLRGSSSGQKGHSIVIGPGREVYEICIKSFSEFYFDILSDTPIKLGTEHDILKELCKEPRSIANKLREISQNFDKLIKSFGTRNYVNAMRNFVASIKPINVQLTKGESLIIFDSFLNNLMECVIRNFPKLWNLKDVLFALKILFLDLRFCLNSEHERRTNNEFIFYECNVCDSLEIVYVTEEVAATKIQALFKGNYVRKLLKYHDKCHEDFAKIYKLLRVVYETIFAPDVTETGLAPLFRRMLFADEFKRIVSKYEFVDDLINAIESRQFSGNYLTKSNDWNPIAKFRIYCNSKIAIVSKLIMTCNLYRYDIKVYDNLIKKELRNVRLINLNDNLHGYTVIVYGWCELEKTIDWRMSFITSKEDSNKVNVTLIPIVEDIIVDNYVPSSTNNNNNNNNYDLLCCYGMRIKEDVTVTVRFITSSKMARLRLIFKDENGKVYDEIRCTSQLFLPLAYLNYDRYNSYLIRDSINPNEPCEETKNEFTSHNDQLYIIEVYDEGYWRLTPEENEFCTRMKTMNSSRIPNHLTNNKKKAYSFIRLENCKDLPNDFQRYEEETHSYSKPYYKMSIVHDGTLEAVSYVKNEEVLNDKDVHQEKEAIRYEISAKLRERFLRKHNVTSDKETHLDEFFCLPYEFSNSTNRILLADVKDEDVYRLNKIKSFDGDSGSSVTLDRRRNNSIMTVWYRGMTSLRTKVSSVFKRNDAFELDERRRYKSGWTFMRKDDKKTK